MMSIRKALPEDAQIISEIGKISFAQSHPHAAPNEILSEYLNEKFHPEKIHEEILDENNIFHLISYNLKVVGFSKIQPDSTHEFVSENPVCKLERLYLLEAYHGKRLGPLFYEFLEEFAKQEKQKGFWLTVWVHNLRAIRFYEKNEFVTVGETNFSLSENYSNPNHVMYKSFNEGS